MMVDLTKYICVRPKPLTASGDDEIIASFIYKSEAVDWMRLTFGRNWRRSYQVRKREQT